MQIAYSIQVLLAVACLLFGEETIADRINRLVADQLLPRKAASTKHVTSIAAHDAGCCGLTREPTGYRIPGLDHAQSVDESTKRRKAKWDKKK